jgi:hypothetical protein
VKLNIFWGKGRNSISNLLRKVTNSNFFNVCLINFLRICFELRKIILKSKYKNKLRKIMLKSKYKNKLRKIMLKSKYKNKKKLILTQNRLVSLYLVNRLD